MKNIFGIYIILIFFLISGVPRLTYGQKKGDISVGMGFPELQNISVKYRVFKQIRTGVRIGWLPHTSFDFGGWNNMVSFSGDLYYHFGRTTPFSDLRLFYVNTGINFILEKPYRWDENWWNSYLRIGGEIVSTRHFGVNVDGGVIFNLNPEINWARMNPVMPAFGVNISYRF